MDVVCCSRDWRLGLVDVALARCRLSGDFPAAPVAQWVKRWPTDLGVLSLSPGFFLAFLGRGPRALWFGYFVDV